jgi:cob(I)alamin adenosyltransferase
MGSCLAADPEHSTMKLPEIKAEDIVDLEDWMDQMEEKLPEMKHFILPGGHPIVSICHIARCVCRRAERNVVTLEQNAVVDPLILAYMNRLSDYLFVLGRKLGQDIGIVEVKWIPKH